MYLPKFLRISIFSGLLAILIVSCNSRVTLITHWKSDKIAIDSTTDSLADKNYEAYLMPIKQKLDDGMNVVIGYAEEPMRTQRPESLLSNYISDAYRRVASEFLGQPVDIAIVNRGGIRSDIRAGAVTIRKIFEIMPFENELSIIWLKGDKFMGILEHIADVGGEGVSGLRMEIRDKKPLNITIGGLPIDTERVYVIATNDYLADGNSGMVQFKTPEKRINTGIKIRDLLIDYIRKETAKGKKVQSVLDGRIKLVAN